MGLLGFSSADTASTTVKECIICEHIGFAETEFQAHLNLLGAKQWAADTNGKKLQDLYLKSDGTALTQTNNYCLTAMLPQVAAGGTQNYNFDNTDDGSGGDAANNIPNHIDTIPGGANGFSYCVAQFFVYYAQDMDK